MRDESAEDWDESAARACQAPADSLLDVQLVQAAENVAPVAVTAGDKFESLRK